MNEKRIEKLLSRIADALDRQAPAGDAADGARPLDESLDDHATRAGV